MYGLQKNHSYIKLQGYFHYCSLIISQCLLNAKQDNSILKGIKIHSAATYGLIETFEGSEKNSSQKRLGKSRKDCLKNSENYKFDGWQFSRFCAIFIELKVFLKFHQNINSQRCDERVTVTNTNHFQISFGKIINV